MPLICNLDILPYELNPIFAVVDFIIEFPAVRASVVCVTAFEVGMLEGFPRVHSLGRLECQETFEEVERVLVITFFEGLVEVSLAEKR